jgi:plastocyanin
MSNWFLPASLLVAIAAGTTLYTSEYEIVQREGKFNKTSVKVSVGDTLRMVNKDDVVHNMVSHSPGYEADLGFQLPGAAASVLLSKAGTAEFQCAIHPRMKVVVTVR